MSEKTREVAESAFQKYQRREAEIAVALREEQARHEAAIKNMHRLRSLRLQQEAHVPPPKGKTVQTRSVQTRSLQTKSSRTKPSPQTKSRKTA
jgi:hypothetical protein